MAAAWLLKLFQKMKTLRTSVSFALHQSMYSSFSNCQWWPKVHFTQTTSFADISDLHQNLDAWRYGIISITSRCALEEHLLICLFSFSFYHIFLVLFCQFLTDDKIFIIPFKIQLLFSLSRQCFNRPPKSLDFSRSSEKLTKWLSS